MGKLTKYILVMSGLVILFHFMGLLTQCDSDGLCNSKTPNSQLLNIMLNPESMNTLLVHDKAILVLEGVSAVGIIATGLFIGSIELAVIGVFAIFFFNLLWDFLYVFNTVFQANPVLAVLLLSPVLLLYIVTIIEWWRGKD